MLFRSDDYKEINSRVIGSPGGPTEDDIPANACYASYTNIDRCAIIDGIFMKVIEKTHYKDPTVLPPQTAISIKATEMRVREGKGTSANYIDMSSSMKDLIYCWRAGECCHAAVVTAINTFLAIFLSQTTRSLGF